MDGYIVNYKDLEGDLVSLQVEADCKDDAIEAAREELCSEHPQIDPESWKIQEAVLMTDLPKIMR